MPSSEVFDAIKDYPLQHLRVLGLPGSGKTRLLIERFRSLAKRGESDVYILTYSTEQRRRITEALFADNSVYTGLWPVLTYFRVAKEIIASSGRKPPRIVEGLEENLLVRKIIADCADDLRSDYRSILESDSFRRTLLDLFHLLLQNGIKGERLERLEAAGQGNTRVADVFTLYKAFGALLQREGCFTHYDISWFAEKNLRALATSHPLRRARLFLIDDFEDVDAGQFALLKALAPPDGETAVNVFGDPMGAYFGGRGTNARYLTHDFPEVYGCETLQIKRDANDKQPLQRALTALEEEVLGGDQSPSHSTSSTRPATAGGAEWGPLFEGVGGDSSMEIRLECVEDEVAEVYTAAANAHRLITNGRYAPSEIAVITNEKARYEAILQAAFAQWGVPLDTGRVPQSVFRDFAHSLLTLLAMPRDAVSMQALKTSPFYAHFRSQYLKGAASGAKPDDETAQIRHHLQHVASELADIEPSSWMTHIVDQCLRDACGPYKEQTGDDSIDGFLAVLTRSWEEYIDALQATGWKPDMRTFLRDGGLFDTRSTMAMPSKEEVGFYSCREVRGRFFPVVLLLGCSELLFPSALQRESIMPVLALQTLFDSTLPELHIEMYGARTPLQHLHEQYHLLYQSLTRAEDVLYLTAPKVFAGRAHPAPANVLDATLPTSVGERTSADGRTPPQIQFVNAWVNQPENAEIGEKLRPLSTAGWLWNLAPQEPQPFAIAPFPLSQSSLETYLRCARRFFFNKVLRIEEEDTGAQKVGRLFHEVMADIGKEFSSKRALHEEVDDSFVRSAVEKKAWENGLRATSLLSRSLLFHLQAMVRGALALDRKEAKDYMIEGVERDFVYDHRGWGFRGRVDRVERTETGSTILDYKTGKVHKTGQKLREKTLDTMTKADRGNWQVPIYVWAHRVSEHGLPDMFRLLAQPLGEEPFFVTLYIRRRSEDLPAAATSRKNEFKRFSYLLEHEIERVMDYAAEHAATIFSERLGFERTEDSRHCRNCMFDRLCNRRTE